MNEVEYHDMQEKAGIGKFLDCLKWSVLQRNQGRNLSCWPVCSFGWKDADLDPEGCTGIKEIRWNDYESVFVDVGGHKTFGYDPDDSQADRDAQWEYLCNECTGYSCDGDAEEFTASFADTLVVPVVFRKGSISYGHTARRIINAARKAVAEFERHMAATEKGLTEN